MINSYKQGLIRKILLLLVCGFIALTVFVILDPLSKIDRKFSEEIQEHSHPMLDTVMRWVSWPGVMPYSIYIVAGASLLFLVFKYKREALFTLLTLAAGLVSTILKLLVNRPRPQANMVRIIEKTRQQSFPSGHVLFYVVFFGFVLFLMLRLKSIAKGLRVLLGGICLIFVFAVPLSRIYLGAHWFSDVLGGFIVGLLCLYGLTYAYLYKTPAGS